MFRRYVSASAVASTVIGLGAVGLIFSRTLSVQEAAPLTAIWCAAPLVWGIWAVLTPKRWVPRWLPVWGAILGLFAGLFAHFVVNMPMRLFGASLSTAWRGVGVAAMVVIYFLLWMLVRAVYRSLSALGQAS
jgi:hypothetical protein